VAYVAATSSGGVLPVAKLPVAKRLILRDEAEARGRVSIRARDATAKVGHGFAWPGRPGIPPAAFNRHARIVSGFPEKTLLCRLND